LDADSESEITWNALAVGDWQSLSAKTLRAVWRRMKHEVLDYKSLSFPGKSDLFHAFHGLKSICETEIVTALTEKYPLERMGESRPKGPKKSKKFRRPDSEERKKVVSKALVSSDDEREAEEVIGGVKYPQQNEEPESKEGM